MSSNRVPSILLLCFALIHGPTLAQDSETSPPWRRSDRTFLQLCFDGLDTSAPKRLRASTVSPGALESAGLDLVGFTLTNRPIYQAALNHPIRFRSLLVQLPDSPVWARIDAPSDLAQRIEAWRDVQVSHCTMDNRADLKVLGNVPLETVTCPDQGLKASMKVAPVSEHSITLIHLKANGPSSFNGLRGCRELVYGSPK
jgi:hypothetical protein